MLVQYLKHYSGKCPPYRIRRSDWPQDVFKVISYKDWILLIKLLDYLNIPMVSLDHEEED